MKLFEQPSARREAGVIALLAGSMLIYEILLTRVCALRVAFHFSFLVISNGLLAVGMGGTALYLARRWVAGRESRWLAALTWAYALSLPLTYGFLLAWPVPAQVKVRDLGSMANFTVFSMVASVPFFFVGSGIGLILTRRASQVHRFYSLDLAGAALGCLACPLLLSTSGAGGTLTGALILACVAGWLTSSSPGSRGSLAVFLVLLTALAIALPRADAWFPVPRKAFLQITEELSIPATENIISSRWSAISRIDVLALPPDQRNLYMKGDRVLSHPEEQCFVMQDGSAGTFVHDFSGTPEGLEALERSLYSVGVSVMQPESVFIIGVGGGPDVWAAHHAGATRIKGIELNQQILDLHTGQLASWSADLLANPGVELVHGEGRSALIRERETWDMVQMCAIDTWTALASGAYMLAENFLYTQDAVDDMFSILAPDGMLQIVRFSGDVEALRLLATIDRVHRERGSGHLSQCVAGFAADRYMAILCKRTPFDQAELGRMAAFAEKAGVVPVYLPDRSLGTSIEAFLRSSDRDAFVASAKANITPVSDDQPYFFNFNRWHDLTGAWQTLDSPMVVTQGSSLFLYGQLGVSLLAGLLLIVLPLAGSRARKALPARVIPAGLLYFGAVGFGFIALEVSLMQKLVLLLGHPLYSITVSLVGILVFSGLGAILSARWFSRPTRLLWLVPLGLTLILAVFALASPWLVRFGADLPLAGRAGLALCVLAPVGLLLGVPFAHGVRLLEPRAPTLIPWAWATNATATVVGSIATVIVSMNFGFRAVFVLGVSAYWIAGLAARRLK